MNEFHITLYGKPFIKISISNEMNFAINKIKTKFPMHTGSFTQGILRCHYKKIFEKKENKNVKSLFQGDLVMVSRCKL